jgi:hypothetical protein
MGDYCAMEINLLVSVLHGVWCFVSHVNYYSYHTLLVALYEAVKWYSNNSVEYCADWRGERLDRAYLV